MVTGTMMQKTAKRGSSVGAPPMPHEHGAWVMLYAPMFIAFAVAHFIVPLPAFLLLLAVTGAFLARQPADLLARGRGDGGAGFWLAVYLAVAATAAAPLILVFHRVALVEVGAIAGVLFGLHIVMTAAPGRKRLDRSIGGEVLAVLGLTLTAPAAYAVATGTLDGLAVCLWAVCALYFGSSIFHVKMLLSGAKARRELDAGMRLRLGRANLLYHALLLAVVLALAPKAGRLGGELLVAAYLPIVLRAAWGTARLSHRLPALKRVGVAETVYALWFTVLVSKALLVNR